MLNFSYGYFIEHIMIMLLCWEIWKVGFAKKFALLNYPLKSDRSGCDQAIVSRSTGTKTMRKCLIGTLLGVMHWV
jgi:hypothetical protein